MYIPNNVRRTIYEAALVLMRKIVEKLPKMKFLNNVNDK
jgi:hypothetical protein